MEKLVLTVQSREEIIAYREGHSLIRYEPLILAEILTAVETGNTELLKWFNGFGDCFRSIIMNVHAYRNGLDFGFTEIGFDEYGWFERPKFLAVETLLFGNEKRYGEHSTLNIGKGPNNTWTNALSYSFGTAGGGCALSVYGKRFTTRKAAINDAVGKLKVMMQEKVGNTDRSNYNPQVIRGTLNAIADYEVERVQLSLF